MVSRRDLGMFKETAEGPTEGQIEDVPREVGWRAQGLKEEVNGEHRWLEGTGGQARLLEGGSPKFAFIPAQKQSFSEA